jgi:hypothetical protein
MYSDRGKATVTGVVGTVIALHCGGMEAVASVMSWVRAPAVEVLLPRRSGVRRPSLDGVGRAGNCVRGPGGSGESELTSEALRGRASRNLRPRP